MDARFLPPQPPRCPDSSCGPLDSLLRVQSIDLTPCVPKFLSLGGFAWPRAGVSVLCDSQKFPFSDFFMNLLN